MKTKTDNRTPFKVTFKYDKLLWEYLLNEKTRNSDLRLMYLAGTLLGISVNRRNSMHPLETIMDEAEMMYKIPSYREHISEKLAVLKKLDEYNVHAYVMNSEEIGLLEKANSFNMKANSKRYMRYYLSATGKSRSDKTVAEQTWSTINHIVPKIGVPGKFGRCAWGEFCFEETGPAIAALVNICSMTGSKLEFTVGELPIRSNILKAIYYLSGAYNDYVKDNINLLKYYKYSASYRNASPETMKTIWKEWDKMLDYLYKLNKEEQKYIDGIPSGSGLRNYKTNVESALQDNDNLLKSVAEEAKSKSVEEAHDDFVLANMNAVCKKKETTESIDIDASICDVIKKRIDQLNNTKTELIKELKQIDDKLDKLYEAVKILEK